MVYTTSRSAAPRSANRCSSRRSRPSPERLLNHSGPATPMGGRVAFYRFHSAVPRPTFAVSMKVKCHQISSAGAVREHNEDFVLFWEPEDFGLRQKLGSLAILADGVGGEGNGDVASRMAVE